MMADQTETLSLLLVEDNAHDAALILRELRRSGFRLRAHQVQTEPEYWSALRAGDASGQPWDVILTDYTLPDFSGLRALQLLREHGSEVPFIVVSGTIGEETAVQIMQAGASDYLLKDRLTRLAPAVRRALDQHRVQEEKRQAEEKYRRLFEDSVAGIYQTTPDGRYLTANSALARILGYDSPAELIASVSDLGGQVYVDPGRRAELRRRLEANERISGFECKVYRKDGLTIWVSTHARAVRDGHGTVLHFEGIIEDITERKRAEDELRRSQQQLVWTLQASHAGVWDWDLTAGVAGWSPEMYTLWGVEPGTRIETANYLALLDERDRERVTQLIGASITGHTDAHYEFRIRHPRSGERWMETHARATYDGQGQAVHVLGMTIDISERKQAEEALRQLNVELEARVDQRTADLAASEAKFRTLFEVLPVGVSILDDQQRVVESNPALVRILKMSREGLAAGAYARRKFIDPNGRLLRSRDFPSARALAEQRPIFNVEIGIVTETGETIWTDVSAAPLPVDGFSAVIATADLTERKHIEAALRESEEKFSKAFHASAAGIAIARAADGRILEVNDGFLRLIGYEREKVIGRTTLEIGAITAADRDRLIAIVREQGHIHEVEYGLPTKTGAIKTVLMSEETIVIGEENCSLSVHYDITERKRIESDLRQSEERFAKAFRSSPIALTITRAADSLFIDVNEGFQSLFGYRREEVIGHKATEFNVITYPDERAEMSQQFRERGSIHNYEVVRRTKSGELRTVLLSADTMELEGEAHILSTMLDITARKQAEAALAREHDLLQMLMDNIPDTIYFKDRASRFTRINRAQARVLGVATPELAIGKTDADFQASHLAAKFYLEEQRLLDSGQPLLDRLEFNPTPAGEPRWLSATKVPLKDTTGQVVGLVGISRDVTERIKTEEALQRVNQQLAERVNELSRLNELAEQLQACRIIEDTYPLTAQFMTQLAPGHSGALYVVNAGRTQVMTAVTWGQPAPKPQDFGLDDCWALRSGQLHLADDEHQGLLCRHLNDVEHTASVCIPLLAQDQALGILHLRATDSPNAQSFDESIRQLAHVVADSVALTCANLTLRETLRQQAIRDPLTGLFNRRFMEESLARELHRAARNRQGVRIIMMDVDRFKRINDRFGHETGDAVLRALGQLLQASSRGSDIPCRYGGEEFLLILPEASLETARQRAEHVRISFRNMEFGVESDPIGPVTLSLGVAAYPQHGEVFEGVLRAADAALYQAKSEGRDRASVAPG